MHVTLVITTIITIVATAVITTIATKITIAKKNLIANPQYL